MIPDNPITREEKYLDAIANGTAEVPEPITREEEYLAYIALNGGGGGGADNYNALSHKPQINGTTLTGNKTTADLGISDDINSAIGKITESQWVSIQALFV